MIEAGNRVLRDEVDVLSDAAFAVNARDVTTVRGRRRAAAKSAVCRRLASRDVPPALQTTLEQMEASYLALQPRGESKGATAWHERQRTLAAVVRRAWDACEELFAWLTETWTAPSVISRLGADAEANATLLERIARTLGFENDETLNSLYRMFLIERRQAKGVVEFDNRDLQAMAGCALLATSETGAHPLHDTATKMPRLFVFLDRLKRERDPVAHHGASTVLDETGEWARREVLQACEAILPLSRAVCSFRQEDDPAASLDTTPWAAEVAQRLRARAVHAVESRFGLVIREHPHLRQDLVELKRLEEETRLVDEGGNAAQDLLKDLLVATGTALEGGLGVVVAAAPLPKWAATYSTEELRATGVALLGELDIAASPEIDTILRASSLRVQRAALSGKGPLATLAMVALLSCRDYADHPLRSIVKVCPYFLTQLARIAEGRGHGDTALAAAACLDLAEEAQRLCQLILDNVD
ncbi:hypothetical protein ACFL59_11050 [Planctomycetota bacterium]